MPQTIIKNDADAECVTIHRAYYRQGEQDKRDVIRELREWCAEQMDRFDVYEVANIRGLTWPHSELPHGEYWVAKDGSGYVFAYARRPNLAGNGWFNGGGHISVDYDLSGTPWRTSLRHVRIVG